MHADATAPGSRAIPQRRAIATRGRLRLNVKIGLVALALPWLFSGPRPVIALACVAILLLVALEASDRLWARYGVFLGAPRREARDAIWFVFGVCLAYAWHSTEPLAYAIAILVTACADAAGRHESGESERTRGSLAFFCTAFFVALGALLAGSGLRPTESLAAAALLAVITTGVESSLSDGLHMLFVPLGALVALEATVL